MRSATRRPRTGAGLLLVLVLALTTGRIAAAHPQGPAPESDRPRILIDLPARAVAYQLDRLTVEELQRVDRRPDDRRYRPVYLALLTRAGVAVPYRDEALAALVAMDGTSVTRVLIEALGQVNADDPRTGPELQRRLVAQDVATLRSDRTSLLASLDAGSPDIVLTGVYAALLAIDPDVDAVWRLAAARDGHQVHLLAGVAVLPGGPDAADRRASLVGPVARAATDPALRTVALDALAALRPDRATFDLLSDAASDVTADPAVFATSVRALLRLPASAWQGGGVESLARAIVARIAAAPATDRTSPVFADAMALGERLAATLPPDLARPIRRDLRALGVRVIPIGTIFEQMSFDQWWFVVQAGRPAQVVFTNSDAMPHNLVLGRPGALEAIGAAAGAMPLPSDPTARAYVPDRSDVLAATRLLQRGETERIDLAVPASPGEYVFLCTFPGHWVRMYGVMLVVEDLEAWEAHPTTPDDPLSGQPFASRRR